MHIERLTKLAEWLEAGGKEHKVTFQMDVGMVFTDVTDHTKVADCQTSCCIAGAATYFFNTPSKFFDQVKKEVNREDENLLQDMLMNPGYYGEKLEELFQANWPAVKQEAMELLELTKQQALQLFEPDRVWGERLITYNDPAWAARTVRHLLATGEADWSATRQ